MENNNSVLLSICIPTYNGVDYLIENLSVLIPQIITSKYGVELIISDNGTPANKFGELKNFLEQWDVCVKLFHHEDNIGGRANFAYAVKQAVGTYVFLLGDDDILNPNILEIIYPFIEKRKYSLVHFNYLYADASLQNAELETSCFDGVIKEMNWADFLQNDSYDSTFMSSIVFLKECWDVGLSYVRDEYYGYEWYAAVIWGMAIKKMQCLFYYFPLCIQRNPPKTWAKDTPVFKYVGLCTLFKDLDAIESGVYEAKLRFLKKLYYDKFFIHITTDPLYYQKYEADFKNALPNDFFSKVRICLHSPFYRVIHLYYIIKMKAASIYRGIRRFLGLKGL